jgi:hypothetical protein
MARDTYHGSWANIGAVDVPVEREADSTAVVADGPERSGFKDSRLSDGGPTSLALYSATMPVALTSRIADWSERLMENFWSRPSPTPSFVAEALRAPAMPLDDGTRTFMEHRFGHSFYRVRIHADEGAAKSAERLGVAAYTAGPHIVFARGQYTPDTESGRRLLAHELAHVVQQQNGSIEATNETPGVMIRDESLERDAGVAPFDRTPGYVA